MLYDLIGTFIVGASMGLMCWLLFRARRRRPPRFLLPLVVGGSMLGYSVWSEYTWASRTIEALPEGVEVIEKLPKRVFWQPWTYAFPRVGALLVLDQAGIRRNEHYPGYVLAELALLERLMPARRVTFVVDCAGHRRADVTGRENVLESGLPPAEAWAPLRPETAGDTRADGGARARARAYTGEHLLQAACAGSEAVEPSSESAPGPSSGPPPGPSPEPAPAAGE